MLLLRNKSSDPFITWESISSLAFALKESEFPNTYAHADEYEGAYRAQAKELRNNMIWDRVCPFRSQ